MKYIKYLIIIFTLLFITNVNAEVKYELSKNYDVVYIKDNTPSTSCESAKEIEYTSENVEVLESFDIYLDAYNYLNNLNTDKVAAIIGKRKNENGEYVNKILYVNYGLVDINTTGTTTTNLYVYTENGNLYTYVNGTGYFGGVDAAFIDYVNSNQRIKLKTSGVTGYVNSLLEFSFGTYNAYEVIPANLVKSPSYYYVNSEGNLIHKLSYKITANNCYSMTINLGPAPSFLKALDDNDEIIKYYSYDSNYFYTSIVDMIKDYRNGKYENAVNSVAYYNYYMYVPIRSKTNITEDDITNFLNSRSIDSSSALYNTASTFKDAESKYGVNAVMSLATAINESGWGRSYLAKYKNNIFGHNAYDSSVMSSANAYNTVADGIYRHAYYLINGGFSETKDAIARYYGSNLGNKQTGICVKYASDMYWGEKIAEKYYYIDSFSGYKDLDSKVLGIKVGTTPSPVKAEPNSSSTTLYRLESYWVDPENMSVIILDTVSGETINGSDVWYKIQTDALLTSDRQNLIQDTTINDYYDWDNNYGYIHSSYLTIRGESANKTYTKVDGIFGLNDISKTDDNKVKITGYLAISNIDNTLNETISYDLILEDDYGNTYTKKLDRLTDNLPYDIPSMNNHVYTYSWFSGIVDLSDIPEGDYTLYVRSRCMVYESVELLSNMLSINILSKFSSNERGYQFKTNYYLKTIPVELFIRDDGLISSENTPTKDNMINQYQSISLSDGKLNIYGSSFNVGGDYSTSSNVERTIIFENITTFERYTYNLGYVDNGMYPITLIVPDNYDKTRAWFNNSVDLKDIPKGTYSIYIKTKSNIEDAAELNDIFERVVDTNTTIDGKTYSIKVNKNQRFRLELVVG